MEQDEGIEKAPVILSERVCENSQQSDPHKKDLSS